MRSARQPLSNCGQHALTGLPRSAVTGKRPVTTSVAFTPGISRDQRCRSGPLSLADNALVVTLDVAPQLGIDVHTEASTPLRPRVARVPREPRFAPGGTR